MADRVSQLKKIFVRKLIYSCICSTFRILAGLGWRGTAMLSFCLASEIAPKEHKVLFMSFPSMGYHIGELIVAIQSYFIRDWITLQLVEYTPILAIILMCYIIPEPARWLMSKGGFIFKSYYEKQV